MSRINDDYGRVRECQDQEKEDCVPAGSALAPGKLEGFEPATAVEGRLVVPPGVPMPLDKTAIAADCARVTKWRPSRNSLR